MKTSKASDTDIIVAKFHGKWGAYQKDVGWLIPPTFDNETDIRFSEGLLRIRDSVDGGYKYLNHQLKEVFAVPYVYVSDFNQGYAQFATETSEGYINTTGNVLFSTPYTLTTYPTPVNGVIGYETKDTFYLYDLQKHIIIDDFNDYDEIKFDTHPLLSIKKGTSEGIYNYLRREYIIAPQDRPLSIRNNLRAYPTGFDPENAIIIQGTSFKTFLNTEGEVLSEDSIDHVYVFIGNLAVFKKKQKYGLMDIESNIIIPAIYEDAEVFPFYRNNNFAFKSEGKMGVVDKANHIIIPFEYEDIHIINDDIFLAQSNGQWGIVDKNQEIQTEFRYDILSPFSSAYVVAEKNAKKGVIDLRGNIVYPFIFEEISGHF